MRTLAAIVAAACLCAAALAQGLRDRDPIDVYVRNGRIVVPEDEAVSEPSHGAIVWRLMTAGHAFPDDGIVIEDGGAFRCRVWDPDGTTYRCQKLRHEPGRRYKYLVNVVARTGQGDRHLPPLDPFIQNR